MCEIGNYYKSCGTLWIVLAEERCYLQIQFAILSGCRVIGSTKNQSTFFHMYIFSIYLLNRVWNRFYRIRVENFILLPIFHYDINWNWGGRVIIILPTIVSLL